MALREPLSHKKLMQMQQVKSLLQFPNNDFFKNSELLQAPKFGFICKQLHRQFIGPDLGIFKVADEVRQQLLRVSDVNKVELFGAQDEKLYIEVSQKRLAQLGLDMNQVLSQLGQQNAVESAGAVQTPLDIVQVRVAGQFDAVEQLAAMPIRASSGTQLRLGDIAEIKRGYVDPPGVKVRHHA